ncbi:hypothetical protein BDV96DRAFT_645098 [Lophiotrema nucula]|uniref:J domain-containing protein n=1 Tax=Lophiotrema nucula TaxID=690887 RepID=A0A6A5ZBS4_9PLEO|nr:hypothetical protein BDV96DRAFT_645098 [Lophiotrema nucula]
MSCTSTEKPEARLYPRAAVPINLNAMSVPKSAYIPSGVYLNPASLHTVSNSPIQPTRHKPSSADEDFVDHYAIIQLHIWATSEEIKASYRKLRTVYFKEDAKKYRALQAAFDILADRQARLVYDRVYRERIGLPGPPEFLVGDEREGRSDSAVEEERGVVKGLMGKFQNTSISSLRRGADRTPAPEKVEERAQLRMPSPKKVIEVEKPWDPNQGLKDFIVGMYEPVIGMQPYHSYVPVLGKYDGRDRHPRWKCSRPKYMLDAAVNSLP